MKIYPNSQMVMTDDTLYSLPDCKYIRIFDEISDEKIKLDDTKPETLQKLHEGGLKLVEKFSQELDDFALRLSERSDYDHVKLSSRLALEGPTNFS